MKHSIAVIGATGNMGSNIARSMAREGHHVILSGRDELKLKGLAETIRSVEPHADIEIVQNARDAAQKAHIVIPAIPYSAQQAVANEIRDVINGKIVVNIMNPFNDHYDGLVTPAGTSAAEELATMLPRATVVKAFNTTFAGDFTTPTLEGTTVDCFVAGDDKDAVDTVAGLVRDAGFHPLHAGGLESSRTLENMMVLLVGLNMRNHYDWHAGWKIVHQGEH